MGNLKAGKLEVFNGKLYVKRTMGKRLEVPTSAYTKEQLVELEGKECKYNNRKTSLLLLRIGEEQIYPKDKQQAEVKKQEVMKINRNIKAPKDTINLMKTRKVTNFALLLNKFANYQSSSSKSGNPFSFSPKDNYVKELKRCLKDFDFDITSYQQRKKLTDLGVKEEPLKLQLTWRFVTGLGIASVYETGMTLHHTYGIPYFPASGLKGVVRSWVLTECFDALDDEEAEQKAMKDKLFGTIFGTDDKGFDNKSHRGCVTFFDAFPATAPSLKVDIMNPHYGKYYGDADNKKRIAPTDTENPVPVPFLTIEDTSFNFYFGVLRKDNLSEAEKEQSPLIQKQHALSGTSSISEIVRHYLIEALTNHGIGAKTAVGYGYFE